MRVRNLYQFLFALLLICQAVWAQPFARGDVFVGVNGAILRFSASGQFIQTITVSPSAGITGMAFDRAGNLYATDFDESLVLKFDTSGNSLGTFGSGFNVHPESIVFDATGNAYVGQADGSKQVLKFSPAGSLIASYSPPVPDTERGTDWTELGSDQKTLYYTSEGATVRRFDTVTNKPLADFAKPGGTMFAHRLLPDGGMLVSHTTDVLRLDSNGNIARTYTVPNVKALFALNLDPDTTSFWTADIITGKVYKLDIASGNILLTLDAAAHAPASTTGEFVGGLAVFGELTAAALQLTSLNPPSATAGSATFTLTAKGSGFSNQAVVMFGTTQLATTFVSSTQLSAMVPASLIVSPATISVTVLNNPGSTPAALSNALNFVVTKTLVPPPPPTLSCPTFLTTSSGAISGSIVATAISAAQFAAGTGFPAGLVLGTAPSGTSATLSLTGTPPTGATSVVIPITATDASSGLTSQPASCTIFVYTPAQVQTPPQVSLTGCPTVLTVQNGSISALLTGVVANAPTVGPGATYTFSRNAQASPWLTVSFAPPGNSPASITVSGTPPSVPTTANIILDVTQTLTGLTSQVACPSAQVVSPPPLFTISCPSGSAQIGSPYSSSIGVSGATNVALSISGNLPPGLSLSGNTISGTPNTGGGSTFSFGITGNSGGQSVVQQCSIRVADRETPKLTPSCPASSGTLTTVYDSTIPISGGGGTNFTFSVSGLPPGLSANGGRIMGRPTFDAGSTYPKIYNVGITASDGGQTVQISCPLTISVLPVTVSSCSVTGFVNAPIQPVTVTATGGTGIYTFTTGGDLFGLSATDTGGSLSISGTPPAPAKGTFSVIAQSGGQTGTSQCSVNIVYLPVRLSGCPAGDATQGVPYSSLLGATGGTGVFQFQLAGGQLPDGFALQNNAIVGTPAATPPRPTSTSQFALQAVSGPLTSDPIQCSIRVAPQKLGVSCPGLSNVFLGQTFGPAAPTSTGGAGSNRWQVTGLPAGLGFDPGTGAVSGTPSELGDFQAGFAVSDAENASASVTCPFTVARPVLTITTECPLPGAAVGAAYSTQINATGGIAPLQWSGVSLPNWLTLTADGKLMGNPPPPAGNTGPIAVQVIDSTPGALQTVQKIFGCGIDVKAPVLPSISFTLPGTLDPGTDPAGNIQLNLTLSGTPSPQGLRGTLRLSFASASSDPAVSWTGSKEIGLDPSRVVSFQVAPNSNVVTFPNNDATVPRGTVAGKINVSLETVQVIDDQGRATDVTPLATIAPATVVISPREPLGLALTRNNRAGGFDLIVTGFSSTLDMQSVTVELQPAAGSTFQDSTVQVQNVPQTFQNFYKTQPPTGSQFQLTVPITVTGTASDIGKIIVTLKNSAGSSTVSLP